jgi:hypothetical protein
VLTHNVLDDNNNPNVPAAGAAAAGPVGTGMSLSGGRNDTVMDNVFENNGAWGQITIPYLGRSKPSGRPGHHHPGEPRADVPNVRRADGRSQQQCGRIVHERGAMRRTGLAGRRREGAVPSQRPLSAPEEGHQAFAAQSSGYHAEPMRRRSR